MNTQHFRTVTVAVLALVGTASRVTARPAGKTCATVGQAIAKQPPPDEMFKDIWPPKLGGACSYREPHSLGTEGLVEVSCVLDELRPERTTTMLVFYRRLDNGCLASMGMAGGIRWWPADVEHLRNGLPEQLIVESLTTQASARGELSESVVSLDAAGTHYVDTRDEVTPLGPFVSVDAYCQQAVATLDKAGGKATCARATPAQIKGPSAFIAPDYDLKGSTLLAISDGKTGVTRFDLEFDIGSGSMVMPDVARSSALPLQLESFDLTHGLNWTWLSLVATERDPKASIPRAVSSVCGWRGDSFSCTRPHR